MLSMQMIYFVSENKENVRL